MHSGSAQQNLGGEEARDPRVLESSRPLFEEEQGTWHGGASLSWAVGEGRLLDPSPARALHETRGQITDSAGGLL